MVQEFDEIMANLFHRSVEMGTRISAMQKEFEKQKELELERTLMQKSTLLKIIDY